MSDFCECGMTLDGYPDEGDGLCATCNAAPHERACMCPECEEYWAHVCRESELAAERAGRQVVCSCGWTGPFIEHHHDREATCVVRLRSDGGS